VRKSASMEGCDQESVPTAERDTEGVFQHTGNGEGGRQGEAPAARGAGSERRTHAGKAADRGDSGQARQRERAPAARGASWEGHMRGEIPSGRDDAARTGGGNADFCTRRTGGGHLLK